MSGQSITADLISESVSTTGDASSANIGVPQSNAPKDDSKVAADASVTTVKSDDTAGDGDKKKKKPGPVLAQKTGRVRVIMPGRNPTPP